MNMRTAERNKKIQLSMSITEKLGSKELLRDYARLINTEWKDVDDFIKKYDIVSNTEEANESYAERWSLWSIYENLGFLLKNGLVDGEVIYNSQGTHPMFMWAVYYPVFKYYREKELGERYFEYYEYLARYMWEMGKKKGLTSPDFKGGLTADRCKDIFEPSKAT